VTTPTKPDREVLDSDCRDAWAVHRGLLLTELAEPDLANNPRWKLLRTGAYEDFQRSMTRCTSGQ
jgi:hypothetical protein